MRVAVITQGSSRQAELIAGALERAQKGSAQIVDINSPLAFALSEKEVMAGGCSLADFNACYITGSFYENPVIPRSADGADYSLWQFRHVVDQQRWSANFSLLARMERKGFRLFNGVRGHYLAFNKYSHLTGLAARGINTPKLLLTNDGEAAKDFMAKNGEVLWRPSTGKAAWQVFRERQRAHLTGSAKAPFILADIEEGPLRHIFVAGNQVIACFEFRPPDDNGLERAEIFRQCEPEPWVAAEAIAALRVSGLGWGMVLCVAAPGRGVVYDVDPDPYLPDMPRSYREGIANRLAAVMLGQKELPAIDDESEERDSLFLRRMLRIGFEMQRSKYSG